MKVLLCPPAVWSYKGTHEENGRKCCWLQLYISELILDSDLKKNYEVENLSTSLHAFIKYDDDDDDHHTNIDDTGGAGVPPQLPHMKKEKDKLLNSCVAYFRESNNRCMRIGTLWQAVLSFKM